jgi:hypothetical protein
MPIMHRRILCLASVGLLAVISRPALAIAQDDGKAPAHVRPEKALRPLVDEATQRSPAVRALIDRLEGFDVTVYIRLQSFDQFDLEGRVGMLAAPSSHRYLVIELARGRTGYSQMATLAHELFHATEIAAEPSVVDVQSLAAFYARIGIQTGNHAGRRTFETVGAAAAGEKTRRELRVSPSRSTDGT